VFFRAVVVLEREEKAEKLQHMWMGSNLEHKGLLQALKDLNLVNSDKLYAQPEKSNREIQDDWKRLASFMSGCK
jgi:hypothetical protein